MAAPARPAGETIDESDVGLGKGCGYSSVPLLGTVFASIRSHLGAVGALFLPVEIHRCKEVSSLAV